MASSDLDAPTGLYTEPSTEVDAHGETLTPDTVRHLAAISRGTIIGRYVVLHPLGEGGMAVVYAAYDPDLDRKVAIKVLHAGSEHTARLQREARAIARLSHPNVVTVYDVGPFGDTMFIAMELLSGGTLTDWLRIKQRPWADVIAMFVQAASGLAAAHAAGLVHRDFKPSNVLIGIEGRPRVGDFGLAGAATEDPAVAARVSQQMLAGLTMTGARMGTPPYMPPEQFEGKPTDHRSDQFSFAVSVFEGLYGKRPFDAGSPDAIYRNMTAGAIAPVPAGSKVPAWLHTALVRALAPRPDARYATLAAFIAELRRDPVRRVRIALVVAMIAVLAACGALLIVRASRTPVTSPCAGAEARLAGIWDEPRRQAIHAAFRATAKPYAEVAWQAVDRDVDLYTRSWVTMRTDACTATQAGEQSPALLDLRMQCLDTRLRGLDALATAWTRADATAVDRSDGAVDELAPIADCANVDALLGRVRLPEQPTIRTEVEDVERRIARAHALQDTGHYAEALPVAHAAVEAARAIGYAPLIAAAELRLGMLQDRAAEQADAPATTRRAILAAEAGGDDELALRAWTTILLREGSRSAFAAAADAGDHARALLHKFPGNDALDARVAYALATLHASEGEYTPAEADAVRAVELARKMTGAPRLASSLALQATIVAAEGRSADALALGQEALAMDEQALGPNHPELAIILDGLARDQVGTGQLGAARASAERSLAIRQAALPPEHPLIAASLASRAVVAGALGRPDDELADDQRALALLTAAGDRERPNLAGVRDSMSHAELALGHADAAVTEAQDALDIREALLGPQHDRVAASLWRLARALAAQGKLPDALAALHRAIAIDDAALPKPHPMFAVLGSELADVLVRTGEPASAIIAADRALEIAAAARVPATRRGHAQFARARARWLTGDRAGAWADVAVALDELVPDPDSRGELAALVAWVAARR